MFAPLLIMLSAVTLTVAALWDLASTRKRKRSIIRSLGSGVLALATVAAMIVAVSCVIDAVAFWHAMPLGALYSINGHRMHLDCEGHGSPTLLLDAGLGNDTLIWRRVQPLLAQRMRVCSYDRAGYGWSEPVDGPRDADHISAELHGLLMAAGLQGPFVLVGHSIAGLYIRDYAARYPEGIIGLVFVDASTIPAGYFPTNTNANQKNSLGKGLSEKLGRGAFKLGLTRLFGACPGSFPGYRFGLTLPRLEGICREDFETYIKERDDFDLSAQETTRTPMGAHIPILIISRDTSDEAWNQKQDSLRLLSDHSRRIVVTGSGHYVEVDRPELLVNQLTLFVEESHDSEFKPAQVP
jgi:pimeloyl-ACP methyl ester carboxylesterase